MSLEINVQLNCDGCDTAYPAGPELVAADQISEAANNASLISRTAQADGWRTRVRRGEREDHCPQCQEVIG